MAPKKPAKPKPKATPVRAGVAKKREREEPPVSLGRLRANPRRGGRGR